MWGVPPTNGTLVCLLVLGGLVAECLLVADGFAAGLGEVGVVEESVDGGGGEGFGHEGVEAGGVDVGADGDGSFFVGGGDDAVERFGVVFADG